MKGRFHENTAVTILVAMISTAAAAQTGVNTLTRTNPSVIGAFSVSPSRPGPDAAGYACPLEFGCEGVEEFFHAIGGHCVTDPEQGIFCEGPDGPEVPHPE